MTIGIIISAYNNPAWLNKALYGYTRQSVMADEVIVADDGSTIETREIVDLYRDRLPIRHVWQEDKGFRKATILNKAVKESTADYLIFTDQDCVPRGDFVATHRALAEEGRYLSGGCFKLSRRVSGLLTEEDIASGRAFGTEWLRRQGQPWTYKMMKLVRNALFARVMNVVTPRAPTFNGCNSSCWRKDAIAVNGYDERMRYGGQDREFGLRLQNNGIRPRQIAYSAIVLHLDHDRPYKNEETIRKNRVIIGETEAMKRVWTQLGIEKESSF